MMLRFLDDVMGFLYKKLVEQRSLFNKSLVQEYTIIVQQASCTCTRIYDHCSPNFLYKNTRSLFNKFLVQEYTIIVQQVSYTRSFFIKFLVQ